MGNCSGTLKSNDPQSSSSTPPPTKDDFSSFSMDESGESSLILREGTMYTSVADDEKEETEGVTTNALGCIHGFFHKPKSSPKDHKEASKTSKQQDCPDEETTSTTSTSGSFSQESESSESSDGKDDEIQVSPAITLSTEQLKTFIQHKEQDIKSLQEKNDVLSKKHGHKYNPSLAPTKPLPPPVQQTALTNYTPPPKESSPLSSGFMTTFEDNELITRCEALMEEERELVEQQTQILQYQHDKLTAENKRLDGEVELRKIVKDSQKEELQQEKTRIVHDECHILKDKVKSIQKRILSDLNKLVASPPTKKSAPAGNGSSNNKCSGASEENEAIETLEDEMYRLHDEAYGLREDLDKKQKELTDDLISNYKLKKCWVTKSQKTKGLTLHVRQCFNQKRTDLSDWVDANFLGCGICQKNLPETLEDSHLKFCSECSCHVCFRCDCEQFHLASQEKQLLASLEAEQEKLISKKIKKKRKKNRQKENFKKKKELICSVETSQETGTPSNIIETGMASDSSNSPKQSKKKTKQPISPTSVLGTISEERDDEEDRKGKTTVTEDTRIESGCVKNGDADFVSYLEETGSILALASVMDELETNGVDLDEGYVDWVVKECLIQEIQNACEGEE